MRETKDQKWIQKKVRLERALSSPCMYSACSLSIRDVDTVQDYLVDLLDRYLDVQDEIEHLEEVLESEGIE